MNIDNLVIETTRRCNMACEHCLRGNAENIDMPQEHVDTLFEKIDYISNITFTGGEPSLAVDTIRYVLDAAIKHEVGFGSFYIATNAKNIDHDFIRLLIDLWLYCDDNEVSAVHWSNDDFHENGPKAVELLSVLSFASPKYSNEYPFKERDIIAEGRGEDWGNDSHRTADGFEIEDDNISDGTLYLNCEGVLIAGCDFSYERQREDENIIIGSVADLSIDLIERHNEKLNN